jgi:hypothetical protein
VKLLELYPVPSEVVTLILPVEAPNGTTAMIVVLLTTVTVRAGLPLKATSVTPLNLVPVIVTGVPTVPSEGVNPVIVGGYLTVNDPALWPVPAAVVTLIRPVVAPEGTVALISVDDSTVKPAEVPLNFTAVAPLKPLPLMVTEVPTGPLVGEKDETTGGLVTVNDPALWPVPAAVVTLIFPVVAPAGTVALISVEDTTV